MGDIQLYGSMNGAKPQPIKVETPQQSTRQYGRAVSSLEVDIDLNYGWYMYLIHRHNMRFGQSSGLKLLNTIVNNK